MTDISRLDLNLLRLFHGMMEQRNLSRTALALGISQPAASAGLVKLRTFFNDDLFVRTGTGMRPTTRAEELAVPVGRIIETLRHELMRVPSFDPLKSERRFNLSMSDIGELVFLPRIIALMRREAPLASVRCLSLPHGRLEHAMERGEVDCTIGYFPDLQGANICCQRLFEHPFTCLLRTDHPIIETGLTIEQFLGADHLVVSQEGRSQEIFERFMAERRLQRRILLHIPHFMSVPQIIAGSDMISIVPLTLGIKFADAGSVRYVPPPFEIPPIPLSQFWHRRVQHDPALSWFRKLVSRTFLNRDPYEVAIAASCS